jgi:hypothetical protein
MEQHILPFADEILVLNCTFAQLSLISQMPLHKKAKYHNHTAASLFDANYISSSNINHEQQQQH